MVLGCEVINCDGFILCQLKWFGTTFPRMPSHTLPSLCALQIRAEPGRHWRRSSTLLMICWFTLLGWWSGCFCESCENKQILFLSKKGVLSILAPVTFTSLGAIILKLQMSTSLSFELANHARMLWPMKSEGQTACIRDKIWADLPLNVHAFQTRWWLHTLLQK